jgi:hypothetical protein
LRNAGVALGIVDHLRRRSATADSSCGEFARFKLYEGLIGVHNEALSIAAMRACIHHELFEPMERVTAALPFAMLSAVQMRLYYRNEFVNYCSTVPATGY